MAQNDNENAALESEITEIFETEIFLDDADESAAEIWESGAAHHSLSTRLLAELIGSFFLVLFGVGTALWFTNLNNGSLSVGVASGIIWALLLWSVGHVSGGHFNPAITLAAWSADRFPHRDVAPYILAQTLGASLGGSLLYFFGAEFVSAHGEASAAKIWFSQLAVGYGEHSPLSLPIVPALVAEAIAVAALALVFLLLTRRHLPNWIAPLGLGLGLALMVTWTMPFTNAALNPARATATALFSEPWALSQLWAFWFAPAVGALVAGLLYRAFGPVEEH